MLEFDDAKGLWKVVKIDQVIVSSRQPCGVDLVRLRVLKLSAKTLQTSIATYFLVYALRTYVG